MLLFIFGLTIFFAVHSVRIYAEPWRGRQIARLGAGRWKLAYALLSLIGILMICWGFGMVRADSRVLWTPPGWTRHLAALLVLAAFILVVAAYLPGTRIRAAVGHPMLAGVKLWALAHLLANGRLADLLLFGAFLAWAVAAFAVARRRDRAATSLPSGYPVVGIGRDFATVLFGTVAWWIFARYGHLWLIGVAPMA